LAVRAFTYQPEADAYTCPAGHQLARKQVMHRDRLIVYAARDCAGCSLKVALHDRRASLCQSPSA
jgi:hypothetical protein